MVNAVNAFVYKKHKHYKQGVLYRDPPTTTQTCIFCRENQVRMCFLTMHSSECIFIRGNEIKKEKVKIATIVYFNFPSTENTYDSPSVAQIT